MFGKILRRLMGRNRETIGPGKSAPPFNLSATDGKKYSFQEALARGPLLVVFFKVSCPTCQYTFPYIERLYQQLRSAGAANLQVWGISQDNAANTQRFAKEYGVTFPLLIDDEPYELSQSYGLSYVPTLFLIAPNGKVEITSDGFSKSDLLAIHKWLAERASVKPPALFQPSDRVPEFKPG